MHGVVWTRLCPMASLLTSVDKPGLLPVVAQEWESMWPLQPAISLVTCQESCFVLLSYIKNLGTMAEVNMLAQ